MDRQGAQSCPVSMGTIRKKSLSAEMGCKPRAAGEHISPQGQSLPENKTSKKKVKGGEVPGNIFWGQGHA